MAYSRSIYETFVDPPRAYTLIPFWFLNDELREEELVRQIDDFDRHGVYGFVPHARIGLPESIPYMSERWLECIETCVKHATSKHMMVCLYDEGMYPSGSCNGKVVAADSRHATRCLDRREKGTELAEDEYVVYESDRHVFVNCRSNGVIRGVHYSQEDSEPGAPPSADILNPEAVARFFRLALEPYYERLGAYFGNTILGVFTDEPDVLGRRHRPGVRPWTFGYEQYLRDYLGYDFLPHLEAIFDEAHSEHARYLRDWRRALNARLDETYYAPYAKWCETRGVALTGHPAQPTDIGVLRHFHVPGQDIVWRYIEPYKANAIEGPQSTMAKCSASAQAHYGRNRNMNECFGAYGWNFTEEEMWWVTNWLLVRGVNLLMPHAFYYSVRDARRDERPPDVGPNNVWWDRYKSYADYCRRLCWLLAEGKQVCPIAVLGSPTNLPWRAARVLFETQRDFNYLDTDTLALRGEVRADGIRVGEMKYEVVVIDGGEYADLETMARLRPLMETGKVVSFVDAIKGADTGLQHAEDAASLTRFVDEMLPRDVRLDPPNPHLRCHHVRHAETHFYLFANEGPDTLTGKLTVAAAGAREWWDPAEGRVTTFDGATLEVPPYRVRVLCCS